MSRPRLVRLHTELHREREVAREIARSCMFDAERLAAFDELSTDSDRERGTRAVLALGLHRWYSAIESILERVERAFGTLPSGAEWHTELLEGAALDMPGIRPAILTLGVLDELRELLKFRHFLRHAYAVELDRHKLLALARDLDRVRLPLDTALTDFEAFLGSAADALGGT